MDQEELDKIMNQANEKIEGAKAAEQGSAPEAPAAEPQGALADAVTEEPAAEETVNGRARGEVTASTIGRMMGLATTSELSVLSGKVDLLATKMNSMTVRMEKVLGILNSAPTTSDLDRIDIQIGALKKAIGDMLGEYSGKKVDMEARSAPKETGVRGRAAPKGEQTTSEASAEDKDSE